MTTRMAVPRVRLQNTNPLTLDERIIYGNIPRWIAEGVEIKQIHIPQANYAKGLRTLPPLYAGHSSGVIKYGAAPRQDLNVKPFSMTSPWGDGGEGLTAYVGRGYNTKLVDSPYVYSVSHLGKQPTRSSKFNAYNQHAKQGFKFWLEEKKPISRSQKYTFGTYKTNLGLGNAPRN